MNITPEQARKLIENTPKVSVPRDFTLEYGRSRQQLTAAGAKVVDHLICLLTEFLMEDYDGGDISDRERERLEAAIGYSRAGNMGSAAESAELAYSTMNRSCDNISRPLMHWPKGCRSLEDTLDTLDANGNYPRMSQGDAMGVLRVLLKQMRLAADGFDRGDVLPEGRRFLIEGRTYEVQIVEGKPQFVTVEYPLPAGGERWTLEGVTYLIVDGGKQAVDLGSGQLTTLDVQGQVPGSERGVTWVRA